MIEQRTRPPVVRGRWYPMSWEEFLDWAPDEGQAEWVDGRGMALVSNTPRHNDVLDFFATLMQLYARMFGLGRVYTQSLLMRLASRPSGRMPDIVFIRADHRDRIGPTFFEGPADLIVEIVSEGNADIDLIEKRAEYAQAGVPEYVIVDIRPRRERVVFLRLGPDGDYVEVMPDDQGRLFSEVIPGFWFAARWLFRSELPDPLRALARIAPTRLSERLAEVLTEPADDEL